MPSAANHKIDKQLSPENALADSSGALSPIRQVITLVEHKIRNLEKRKVSPECFNRTPPNLVLLPHVSSLKIAIFFHLLSSS